MFRQPCTNNTDLSDRLQTFVSRHVPGDGCLPNGALLPDQKTAIARAQNLPAASAYGFLASEKSKP